MSNYAFIDSQNLNLGIKARGWILDFKRFRIYLRDKHHVSKAFLFVGYVAGNEMLYTHLQEAGYIIIWKPTLEYKKDGKRFVKGNVDGELILHAMIEFANYKKAVVVSGDGDFYCLIEYLISKDKLHCLCIPNQQRFSSLLRKFRMHMQFLDAPGMEQKLSQTQKRE